ncbi:MAG TPA: alpha/beta fold hydrolase [Pseudomonas sp.]|uniref:alpha/beta hydrolase n=1 Tax=Pseudomonas sp. TaxID=306 RepID=UPI002CE90F13|nr:alpha/beta fold hydrolase [Pseudomonas sp.]HTO18195.1 alpha/beta fold hydrolase [Pseudomonas sp.]
MLTRETPLQLDGPSGALEALYLPVPDARGLALICHPNPVKGGTMLNKVVSTLQRTARDAGYSTLRFNYRGVGASAGSHDMHMGEVDDAEAACDWLRAQHPELPLSLLGFSFGGFVAAALGGRLEARGQQLEHIFMVAPAVMRLDENVALPQSGTLTLIQPEDDEVVPPAAVYAWSEALARPHELLKVAECGHFFHGRLTDLKELVSTRL